MKRLRKVILIILVLLVSVSVSYADDYGATPSGDGILVNTNDVLNSNQTQNQTQIHNQTVQGPGYALAGGGDSYSDGGDASSLSYSPRSRYHHFLRSPLTCPIGSMEDGELSRLIFLTDRAAMTRYMNVCLIPAIPMT